MVGLLKQNGSDGSCLMLRVSGRSRARGVCGVGVCGDGDSGLMVRVTDRSRGVRGARVSGSGVCDA